MFNFNKESFLKAWAKHNIYDFKKYDGILYAFFYILVPVLITALGFKKDFGNNAATSYFYITILVSVFNCAYDIANRWKHKTKHFLNTKLFIMLVPLIILMVYCIYEILKISITNTAEDRMDYFLYVYFITIGVALTDVIGCFSIDMALADCSQSE